MRALILCICIISVLSVGAGQAVAEKPERLLGISTNYDKGEITIEVASTGCTSKDDFRFEYKENALTVIRKNRDACKAMPRKIGLVYKLNEIGIDQNKPFRLTNAFIVNEHLTGF